MVYLTYSYLFSKHQHVWLLLIGSLVIELTLLCSLFSYHVETTSFSFDLQFIFEFVERSSSGRADADGQIR